MAKLLYRGSTKDIYELSEEECLFKFSNRYSIFDWGEMPDPIDGKGESTAELTNYIFNYFEKEVGCPTHLLKKGTSLDELIVRRVVVPRNEDIFNFYQKRPQIAFVPLEVIFRLGVPRGSSLIERGLYSEGYLFSDPLIEFTTKLETTDRLLTDSLAQTLSGMTETEFLKLKMLASRLALGLKSLVEKNGLRLWDGKFEFAFIPGKTTDERSFMLVDSISLDELRLTFDGFPLSKEILRQIYKHTPWYEELKNKKRQSPETFRSDCSRPFSLSLKTQKMISGIYLNTQRMLMGEIMCREKLETCINELKNEHSYLR